MPLMFRRLGPADVATLRRLNALFAEAFEDADAYAAAPPDNGYVASRLGQAGVIVLVATTDDDAAEDEAGDVVGGLVAYEFDKLERARREIYIYDLAVAASHRRQGIATALIDRLRGIAKERGAWMIFVQADYGDDPAVALYTKLGTREDVMHFDIAP